MVKNFSQANASQYLPDGYVCWMLLGVEAQEIPIGWALFYIIVEPTRNIYWCAQCPILIILVIMEPNPFILTKLGNELGNAKKACCFDPMFRYQGDGSCFRMFATGLWALRISLEGKYIYSIPRLIPYRKMADQTRREYPTMVQFFILAQNFIAIPFCG